MPLLFAAAQTLLLMAAVADASAQVVLRGFVTDAANGQSLPGANVILLREGEPLRGGVADADGFYQISGIAEGRYLVRISYVGYLSYADTVDLRGERFVTLSVSLERGEEALDEVVVEADQGAARRKAGVQTIRPQDLARIPTPDLSGDLASYLQSLPGVVAQGDRGGRLYVRGGTPAQNLVLVDGNLIFQPFHIVGFFSAFPQDLISSVDMYAGGFGARYSGRVSSVIDVTTRNGSTGGIAGSASLSPFLVGARVEGPFRKGSSSYLASFRTSVIDELAPVIADQEIPVDFSDFFLKLYRTDGQNDRCSATLVRTSDRGLIDPADVADPEEFRWSNFVLGGQCLAFPSGSPFLFEGNAGVSYVGNRVGSPHRPERTSYALQFQTDVNFTYRLERTSLRWGLFARANWTGYELGGQFENLANDSEMLVGAGAYADVQIQRGSVQAEPGLSVTVHPFTYSPSFEPRFRFLWQPFGPQGSALSGAAGLYRQTLAGISDERDAGSLFTAWIPTPTGWDQTSATHALLGWQQPVTRWLTASIEGYHKWLHDLHVPIWSNIARFTTALQPAKGRSYGYDARMEFEGGPMYLFAGYGQSYTQYTVAQENFPIWFGEPTQDYHPPHDLRHQLTLLVGFRFGRTEANVQWQYGSGLPLTKVLGFDDIINMRPIVDVRRASGTTRILFDRPYTSRLPSYHRLDLSVQHSIPFSRGELTFQAGAVNTYDRSNIFYLDIFTLRRVDQLPLVPFGGFKIELR